MTITITGVNDPPTAVDDANTTTEDAPVSAAAAGVLANDTDPDAGDTKTVVRVNGLPRNVGAAITTAERRDASRSTPTGRTPTTPARRVPVAGRRTDRHRHLHLHGAGRGGGAVDRATVTITITGVNDAPVVTTRRRRGGFTEDGAGRGRRRALTVTDVDNANLDPATVQITANYQNGQDVLAFTNRRASPAPSTPPPAR